jgi:CheY-like chemotaxis protein/anti-sigma regulatory factor (Ser/Thr protein kinase)
MGSEGQIESTRTTYAVETTSHTRIRARRENGMRILAEASHDLRQPLQAIGLWVELLQQQVPDQELKRVLGRIQETAVGAEKVVDALLEIARLDIGAVAAKPTSISAGQVLEMLSNRFRPAALAKGIDFEVIASPAIVRSDLGLLIRILSNIVSNAVRYTTQGSVRLSCVDHCDGYVFEVRDTGPGIPAADQERIFEEFVQLDIAGRQRSSGVGLGLSIAQRMSRLLGHTITIQSSAGEGSCFRVRVPSGLVLEPKPTIVAEVGGADAVRGAFVVYVEDDENQRDAMRELLESWGCHVIVAVSAQEALAKMQGHLREPDLMVCDYKLSGGENGMQAIAAVRASICSNLPALIVCGESAIGLHATRIKKSRIALLRKPVRAEHLRQGMAALLKPV